MFQGEGDWNSCWGEAVGGTQEDEFRGRIEDEALVDFAGRAHPSAKWAPMSRILMVRVLHRMPGDLGVKARADK